MNAKRKEQIEQLRSFLKREPADASTISAHLGISQSTFSRIWKEAGTDVIAFGAARATQYGIARAIADIGSLLPIFQVQEDGTTLPYGELRILQNGYYAFTPADDRVPQVTLGLPFFLQDLRPQGFLGRTVPLAYPELQLPHSILDWSDEHTLLYLAKRGEDVPGHLIVGNESYQRFASKAAPLSRVIEHGTRKSAYADLAQRAIQGDPVGSSAGGEQPKFAVPIQRHRDLTEHVIVKFSPQLTTPNGRRWADLLIAEHTALSMLNRNEIAACQSELIETNERIYLEVVRFDRIGRFGRKPVIPLAGPATYLGILDRNWTDIATVLHDKHQLSTEDLDRIRLLDVFGALIGNTDRHPGNVSLAWKSDETFTLLPIYDMLPMLYRPNMQGEIVEREFSLNPLSKLDLRHLPRATAMAISFWKLIMRDTRISPQFAAIARSHLEVLTQASTMAQITQSHTTETPATQPSVQK